MEVVKLKKIIASSSIEGDSESSSSQSSIPVNSIIPDSSILDSMPKLLHDAIVESFLSKSTCHTTIAYDGVVCNFPLPQVITIVVDVSN